MKNSRLLVILCLGGMIAAAVALTLAWGAAEKGPPRWDDSWYLAAALRLFDRFAEEGLAAYWNRFQFALGDKAPLITLLPFPFFCLIGRSVFVIYLVNSVACVLIGVALYRFSRKFFDDSVALLAVLFALASPLLSGLSRVFLVEYWLTALVMLSCLALAEWEQTVRYRWLLWLGVCCGLGLLMKITFPAFVGPVIAVILWRRHGKHAGRLLLDVAVMAAPALLLAGPWYWHNWEGVTHRSLQETYFAPVHETERQPAARMALDYIILVSSHGVSTVAALASAAGLVAWALRRRDNFLRDALYYVGPWVVSLPVFALSENRDIRLIAPMIPALALAAAAAFHSLLEGPRAIRALLVTAVAAGSLLVALANSFALFGTRAMRLGPWQVFSYEMSYAFPPNPQRWPLAEVLERIAHRERLGARSKLIVGLGADTWSFNSNNLDLQAALLKYPFEFHTTAYTSNRNEVRKIMSGTQYFLVKDGGTQQPVGKFQGGPMTLEFLKHGPLFRELEPPMATPDGGRIRIFENSSAGPDAFAPSRQPASLPELPRVDLNFGNVLQLKGLRASEKDGVVTLQTRWRCLNPAALPYRCFAHIVDGQGKLVGSMDHEILHGSPPLDQWQQGDEAYEARYLALPTSAVRGAHLRIGLFDIETGVRVAVWASTLPLKDGYTAAAAELNQTPPEQYTFQMTPAELEPCDVEFEDGLRLSGYSLRRSGGVAWLRLRWEARRRPSAKLHFFGHAVADESPTAAIQFSFDQYTALDRAVPSRDGKLEVIQDVVRDVSRLGPEAKLMRAGVFDLDKPDDRIAIRRSSLPMSRPQKAFYLRLPAQ